MDVLRLNNAEQDDFIKEVSLRSGQDVSTCYQCGNCTASCLAGFTYDLKTHQIMRCLQLGLRKKVLSSRSLWMCLSCSTCSERCPNNIDVAAIMEVLRHMAREEGYVTVPKIEKFWKSFLDTVRYCGRTYELGVMVLYMMRSGRIFTDVDLAPVALIKRKLGILPHGIKEAGNAEAVGRIMKRYQKRVQAQDKG